ncbi:MAG TPA: hypothetical protein VIL92_06165 [Gaiellaceae bacterium]
MIAAIDRCESHHEFHKVMPGVQFRCLYSAAHEGDHYAWVGTRRTQHDLWWTDEGVELEVACRYGHPARLM